MTAPVILVEVSPRSPVDAAATTVRLAGLGAEVPYLYGDTHWRAGLAGLPKVTSSLEFDGEQLGGASVPQALELVWSPGSSAVLAELDELFWTDAPIVVRIGPEDPTLALPPIVHQGLVLDHAIERGALRLPLAEAAVDLKRPLLVDRFAGTGGIEGPVELQGIIKPRSWGPCFNVPGRLLDRANEIWCFGDPLRSWRAFDHVRDRGAPADPDRLTFLDWQGSADATFAALQGAQTIEGGGVLCPSIASIKWWTTPGALHADIRGEVAGGYVETAAEIAQRIVSARSALTFADGAIAAAKAARPAAFGWRVDSDSTNANDVLSEMLAGVSLSWIVVNGQLQFRRWEWTASTKVARSFAVARKSTFKPVATRKLGYRRNWAPMARGDLAAIVLAQDVTYADGTTGETMKPAEPGATKGATVDVNLKDAAGNVLHLPEIANRALSLSPDGMLSADLGNGSVPLGRVKLLDLGAATETDRRRLTSDLERLAAAVAQLGAGQQIVQNVFRDAGLYTDPASGVAKLFAIEQRAEQITKLSVSLDAALSQIGLKASVDYVDQRIANAQFPGQQAALGDIYVRLTSAEANLDGLRATVQLKADATTVTSLSGTVQAVQQTLDALGATVALKASQTQVDRNEQRLTFAEQVIQAMDGASIAQSVSASRRLPIDQDKAGEASILDMLSGARNLDTYQAGIAAARTELSARVSGAFDAIASVSTQLAVQIGQVMAQYATETAARIGGDQSIVTQLSTFQSQTGQNLATINQALVTQTGTNTAVAGRIDALSTTVGGHTNTLTTYGQSIEGLRAQFGVEYAQDGVVTGFFKLDGSGSRFDAAFLVSSFRIATRAANGRIVTPFALGDDGKVYMTDVVVTNLAADTVTAKQIVSGGVGFDQLQLAAAGQTLSYELQNDVTIGRGGSTEVMFINITKLDADSEIEVQWSADVSSQDDVQFLAMFQVDGQTVKARSLNEKYAKANARTSTCPIVRLKGVAAGPRRIGVTFRNDETDNASMTVYAGTLLKVTEIRKALLGLATGGEASGSSGNAGTGSGTGGGSAGGGTYNGGVAKFQTEQ